jgi:hypothetical protein
MNALLGLLTDRGQKLREWIRQPSQSGNNIRHHVEVHASHREKEWESQSASLIEKDPEVVPDVDIAAHVCLSSAKLRSTDSVNPRAVLSRVRPRCRHLL